MFLAESRSRIEEGFEALCHRQPEVMRGVRERLETCEARVALAVKYLYSTMPYSDLGNYAFAVFEDFAAHGVMLWENYESVRALPEELFLNYVLHHRVNEEEIAPCRDVFWRSILEYLSCEGREITEEAAVLALDVNLWCCAQAAYRSSDARTVSARTVFESGRGRCGEESVFAVNALRSVGLPARQVYAPWWSHCDDNHAWVEVWADGAWHFMGACEPQPALDRGWFHGAASRAMIVHARRFDAKLWERIEALEEGVQKYAGAQEARQGNAQFSVIGREGMALLLNRTGRYARTRTVTVRVQDDLGRPVCGAETVFEVINYAGLAPVARTVTDADGCARLRTGCGSLHVEVVSCAGQAAVQDVRNREPDADLWRVEAQIESGEADVSLVCVLQKELQGETEACWSAFEQYAPPAGPPCAKGSLTEQEKKAFQERVDRAVSHRMNKIRSWENAEIARFLNSARTKEERKLRRGMLELLTEKDRLDLKAEILEEHFQDALRYEKQYPREIFVRYILNPRVHDEIIRPWRAAVRASFTQEEQEAFRRTPERIWETIEKRINEEPEYERLSIYTTPAAALRLGTASEASKKILFAAVCRTLGIPARLNPQNLSAEYWRDGCFYPARPEEAASAWLVLGAGDGKTGWSCNQNWSLARMRRGVFETLPLAHLEWRDKAARLPLTPGRYRLLTARRLANGNVFAYRCDFRLADGERRFLTLRDRTARLEDLLACWQIPDFSLQEETSGRQVKASVLAKKEKMLFVWLEEGQEPTEHILNELTELWREYTPHQRQIALIVRDEAALFDPTLRRCREALPEVRVYFHDFKEEAELAARSVYTEPGCWPLVIAAKTEPDGLRAFFGTGGYNVGTGELTLQILEQNETNQERNEE